MRWEIKTKTNIEDISDNKLKKTTQTIRSQYITVGDIVGMGKSAAGAVQQLAKSLPRFANSLKDQKSQQLAKSLNNIVQPLSIIMEGMDGFKKVMGVIDVLTPIMKTIARGTGVWCSPGNVADIAQIVTGTVQQILVAILTSSILKLKEMIWKYEFNIRNIPDPEISVIISKHLKESNLDISLDKNIYFENDKKLDDSLEEIQKDIDSIFDDKDSNVHIEIKDILDALNNNQDDNQNINKKCLRQGSYITEHKESSSKFNRLLSGSMEDKGIYYSDDNGATWKHTNQTTGYFKNFAKIKKDNGYIYVAGSLDFINTYKNTMDDSFAKDIYKEYNKDYYFNNKRLNKYEKDQFTSSFMSLKEKDEVIKGKGIYYSNNDGIDWVQTNINDYSVGLFFEYDDLKSLDDTPTIVAASSNYDGLLYTIDGINWSIPTFNFDESSINHGHWNILKDTNSNVNKLIPNDVNTNILIPKLNIEVIENVDIKFDSKITMTPYIYPGEYFDDIENYDSLIREILNYIHLNYDTILASYSNEFWFETIKAIKEGKYTITDAINGLDYQGKPLDGSGE